MSLWLMAGRLRSWRSLKQPRRKTPIQICQKPVPWKWLGSNLYMTQGHECYSPHPIWNRHLFCFLCLWNTELSDIWSRCFHQYNLWTEVKSSFLLTSPLCPPSIKFGCFISCSVGSTPAFRDGYNSTTQNHIVCIHSLKKKENYFKK